MGLAIALISLIALLLPFSVARADEAVAFPDTHLQARIREAIGRPTGDIYLTDLKGLTRLSADSAGITDLTGLEYCTDLTYLSLAYNGISDISPLVENNGLGQGDTVDLAGNPLDTNSVDVYIPQLQQRGVILGWGDFAPHRPNTYAQTYTPDDTTRVHPITANTFTNTINNSHTREGRNTFQYMGHHRPCARSPGSRRRGILHSQETKVKSP